MPAVTATGSTPVGTATSTAPAGSGDGSSDAFAEIFGAVQKTPAAGAATPAGTGQRSAGDDAMTPETAATAAETVLESLHGGTHAETHTSRRAGRHAHEAATPADPATVLDDLLVASAGATPATGVAPTDEKSDDRSAPAAPDLSGQLAALLSAAASSANPVVAQAIAGTATPAGGSPATSAPVAGSDTVHPTPAPVVSAVGVRTAAGTLGTQPAATRATDADSSPLRGVPAPAATPGLVPQTDPPQVNAARTAAVNASAAAANVTTTAVPADASAAVASAVAPSANGVSAAAPTQTAAAPTSAAATTDAPTAAAPATVTVTAPATTGSVAMSQLLTAAAAHGAQLTSVTPTPDSAIAPVTVSPAPAVLTRAVAEAATQNAVSAGTVTADPATAAQFAAVLATSAEGAAVTRPAEKHGHTDESAAIPTATVLPAAGTAPATAAVHVAKAEQPAPTHAPVHTQLAQTVLAHRASNGSHSVSLNLHPADLGTVAVEIRIKDGTVSVALSGANEAAQHAIRASLADLHTDLAKAGLTGTQISLSNNDNPSQTGQNSGRGADQGNRYPSQGYQRGTDVARQQATESQTIRPTRVRSTVSPSAVDRWL